MRTTTNVYLGNLAVADSFLLLIRLIRYVGTYFYSPVNLYFITPFNNAIICGLPLQLINFFYFVSVFFISLVAYERYNSICRPLTHRRVTSKPRTLKFTLFAWILPLVFVSCFTGSFDLQEIFLTLPSMSSNIYIKTCTWKGWVAMSIESFDPCQFWAAFVGNCTMYIAIVRKLSRKNRGSTHSNKSTLERNQVAKMLIINACVFFISLMPMQVHQCFRQIDKFTGFNLYRLLPNSFLCIAIVTALMNSAVNPLIYGVANPNYRKAFRRTFFFSCPTDHADRADTPDIEMQRNDVNM